MTRALALLALLAAALPAATRRPQVGRIALVLEDAPLASRIRSRAELAGSAARAAARGIQDRQAAVRAELKRRGFHVTSATHTLVDAVFVAGTRADVKRVSGIPGVRRVVYLPPVHLDLDSALPLIHAPEAWNQIGGMPNGGAGVKIGIIDTGIDQTHPAFQQSCGAPAPCMGGDCAFTNGKIIVARSYVAMLSSGDPQWSSPDDTSPRDRVGHGTAMAMIAAGNQVDAPAATISGVAPAACLGSYKVFGSPGVNDWAQVDAIVQALTDAFADGMDIVSISSGSTAYLGPLDTGAVCGADPGEYCDLSVQAIEQAVQKGMTVVVAAGNAGDIASSLPALNTIDSPGTAPSAITVGASNNAHTWFEQVKVGTAGDDTPDSLRQIPARLGDGPQPTPAADPYPLKDVSSLGDARACSPLPAGSLNGTVAIIDRGDCFFADKVLNAQNAGARAVVFVENISDVPTVPGGLQATAIPAAMIGRSDGAALRSFLASHENRTAVLDSTPLSVPDPNVNRISSYSSRGPAIGTFGIKPEVLAPGNVYTATQDYDPASDMYDSTRYSSFDGTSFSTPIVAGVAALVKQAHPTYTPGQIKSAIVNTATRVGVNSVQLGILEQGAGLVNAGAAVRANITVEPATITFGTGPLTDLAAAPPVTLTVNGDNWGARVEQITTETTAHVNLVRNGNRLTVSLSGTLPGAGVYSGNIVISDGVVELRVPYVYFVTDSVPHTIVPVFGDNFYAGASPVPTGLEAINGCNNGDALFGFKLVDRFGIPIDIPDSAPPSAVIWSAITPGPVVDLADTNTEKYGLGFACVKTSPSPQDDAIRVSVNYIGQQISYDFYGVTRAWPVINTNGIVDAASNTVDPDHGLAPGSLVSIYGLNLADGTAWAKPVPGYPLYLPISLAGVSLTFDDPSRVISVPGRLLYVSPLQINAQIPWELEGSSSVKMKIWTSGFPTLVYDLKLRQVAPQLFQYASDSSLPGFAVAQFANTTDLVTPSTPAARGQWVTLWGNAFGPVQGGPATGEVLGNGQLAPTVNPAAVTIGGRPAEVSYSGLHPDFVGLYQLNVKIPDDAPAGNQPIVVTIAGVSSNPANIAIAR